VVVAGQRQHAAPRAGAGGVGVLEHVAAAVHAGAFAVPHGKHAVVLGARVHVDLLRAPYAGGGEVFVQPRLELDVMALQVPGRLPGGLIHAAQRRAAVAGDEASGVQALHLVALPLQHGQADERLRAAHVGAAALECPFVVERDLRQCTADSLGKGRVHAGDLCQKSCLWGRRGPVHGALSAGGWLHLVGACIHALSHRTGA